MEINGDIYLKGNNWGSLLLNLEKYYKRAPYYDIFMLCLSVGIRLDNRKVLEKEPVEATVGRNVIEKYQGTALDRLFQTAILTTQTENLSEEERVKIAFGDKVEFPRLKFLTEFANYGAEKILEQIDPDSDPNTMANLIEYMDNLYQEYNPGIDYEDYLEDIQEF